MTTMTTARRPGPARARKRRRRPVLAIAASAAGALALLAILIGSATDDETPLPAGTEQVRAVTVSGSSLPQYRAGADDPASGMAAPVVNGSTFSGEPVTVGGAGEPQVLLFLAHWCPHCRAEVPVITDWLAVKGLPAGVRLAAVSTAVSAAQPNFPPSAWLAGEDWPLPTMADNTDQSAAAAYGLTGFPYFVAIGADGNVVARASGELPVEEIEALVAAARNGVPGAVLTE